MKVKKKLVLKPFVVPMIYGIFALVVVTSLFFTIEIEQEKDDLTYVSSIILNDSIPVIKVEDKVNKPYTNENVRILNDYYDNTQEDNTTSILVYENNYIQNTGINYK